ncbi:hypothetical protein CDL12_22014 [Handroanthus impetiginosus]|uniref:Germin-like protein n=1 Tax=Handroanthus impetiginosus TaxID=429701 RepID=A0A2G9GJI0_9LAMI|nr:hypothetical protein CDL12_22014 [Handroanthus impetiginosus]
MYFHFIFAGYYFCRHTLVASTVELNIPVYAVFVNGKICKDPKIVTPNDFSVSVFVDQLPGLNTLGISLSRIDYAPYSINPPHVHPRSSEVFVVMEDTLYAGFITSNRQNPNVMYKLFAMILHPGDVYVFPRGLIHFQYNVGKGNAVAFAGFNSQYPGLITLANALFGSEPPLPSDVLAKAFQLDEEVVEYLQSIPWIQN